MVRPERFELPASWFVRYNRILLLSAPDYAGVRRFNGLFIGFSFLARIL